MLDSMYCLKTESNIWRRESHFHVWRAVRQTYEMNTKYVRDFVPWSMATRETHILLFFPLIQPRQYNSKKANEKYSSIRHQSFFTIRVNKSTDLLAFLIWINFNVWKLLSNTFNNKRFQGQGINDPWPYLREILVHCKARWLNSNGNFG